MASRLWTSIIVLAAGAALGIETLAGGDSLLTGNMQADMLHRYHPGGAIVAGTQEGQSTKERSVPLAAALSAVLPGAGQVYNRSWLRAAVAVGIETSLLTGYVIWRNRGRDGEDEFIAYAHQYWSPLRYAQWLNGYTGYSGPDVPMPPITEDRFRAPESWTAEEAREVRAFFTAIKSAEEQSYHIETGAAFSHTLPYFGEQQYYELIGKYFQFAPGWSDYNGANDPEESGPEGGKVNVPPGSRFFEYADMHGEANDYLRRASRVSAFVIFNHFLAVFDAAITAKLRNNRLQTKLALVPGGAGDLVTVAAVRLSLP